jgi:hypothetical protein
MRASEILRKTAAEEVLVNFDFAGEMAATETISTVDTFTATPAGPTFIGTAIISGQKVQQKIGAGTVNTRYTVKCQITTSNQILEGYGTLVVEDEA